MMKDMLQLCSKKNIEPWVITYPLSKVYNALQKIKKSEVKYRIVLINDL